MTRKIAVVTGASRGLGRNTALLSEDGRWINGQRIEISGGVHL